jgi:hypothetical protein
VTLLLLLLLFNRLNKNGKKLLFLGKDWMPVTCFKSVFSCLCQLQCKGSFALNAELSLAWRNQTKLSEWPFILCAEQLKTVWQPVLTSERYTMSQQLHVLSLMTMFGVEITYWIERYFLGAQNKCLVWKFRGISSSFRPVISKVGCAWCSTRVQEETKPCRPSASRMYTY